MLIKTQQAKNIIVGESIEKNWRIRKASWRIKDIET